MEIERVREYMRHFRERRAETRGDIRSIRRGNVALRRIAWGLLVSWAFVATVAVVGLAVQSHDSAVVAQRSARAVRLAEASTRQYALAALRAEQATAAAAQASAKAVRAQQLVAAIQASRVRDCEAANARHDKAVAVFQRLLTQAVRAHPSQRAQVRQSRGPTLRLIDAIVPHYNCRNP